MSSERKGTAMHIQTVEYRRLRSFGSFENETVGAVAMVADGETPEEALSALREWVAGQLALACDVEEIESLLTDLRAKRGYLERSIADGERKYAALRDILAVHGIELPERPQSPDYDLPF